MKKIFLLITFLIISIISANANNEDYDFLPKGTFIPVYPTKTLSTSVLEEGDTFYFVVPSDMWIEEYKIIPKNSIIKSTVTMLKMPVTGINAAIKLYADEIIFPNGDKYPIKGSLAYRGETQIGGNLTPPLSYNKSFHIRKGQYYNGMVGQYVPSGKYEFGQHITLLSHEQMQVVLDEEFKP